MKKIIILILLGISPTSFGHETYMSFAEMEFNQECSCLEISISVSSHHLNTISEDVIQKYQGLETALNDQKQSQQIITDVILEGFTITQNSKAIYLNFEGFELFNDGNCAFYFKSERIESNQINVKFDLFMQNYTDQQNKLLFIRSKEKVEPYNFFIFRRQTEIKL